METLINHQSFVSVLLAMVAMHFVLELLPTPTFGDKWRVWAMLNAASHAWVVYAITLNVYLGVAEFVAYFAINHMQTVGVISKLAKHGLNLLCKLLWALVVLVVFMTTF